MKGRRLSVFVCLVGLLSGCGVLGVTARPQRAAKTHTQPTHETLTLVPQDVWSTWGVQLHGSLSSGSVKLVHTLPREVLVRDAMTGEVSYRVPLGGVGLGASMAEDAGALCVLWAELDGEGRADVSSVTLGAYALESGRWLWQRSDWSEDGGYAPRMGSGVLVGEGLCGVTARQEWSSGTELWTYDLASGEERDHFPMVSVEAEVMYEVGEGWVFGDERQSALLERGTLRPRAFLSGCVGLSPEGSVVEGAACDTRAEGFGTSGYLRAPDGLTAWLSSSGMAFQGAAGERWSVPSFAPPVYVPEHVVTAEDSVVVRDGDRLLEVSLRPGVAPRELGYVGNGIRVEPLLLAGGAEVGVIDPSRGVLSRWSRETGARLSDVELPGASEPFAEPWWTVASSPGGKLAVARFGDATVTQELYQGSAGSWERLGAFRAGGDVDTALLWASDDVLVTVNLLRCLQLYTGQTEVAEHHGREMLTGGCWAPSVSASGSRLASVVSGGDDRGLWLYALPSGEPERRWDLSSWPSADDIAWTWWRGDDTLWLGYTQVQPASRLVESDRLERLNVETGERHATVLATPGWVSPDPSREGWIQAVLGERAFRRLNDAGEVVLTVGWHAEGGVFAYAPDGRFQCEGRACERLRCRRSGGVVEPVSQCEALRVSWSELSAP